MADKTYTVTVATGQLYDGGGATGNVYYLDGVRDMDLTWTQGATLRFNQDDSSNDNHPLLFTVDKSNPNSGRIETGVVYNLDGSSVPYSSYASGSFNSATTRYVEITPASATDFYYYCFYHGIGMGGEIDVVNDAWGSLSWSTGPWGNQDDIDLQVTGFPLSLSLQSVTTTAEVNSGWGRSTWGDLAWGAAFGNATAEPTGIGMTVTLGDETIAGEINTGWGREAWGQQVWGDNENFTDVSVTGQQLTIPTGSVTINSEINLGWGRKAWGDLSWGVNFANETAEPTGIGMSATLGSVSLATEVNTGWGRANWGELGWGIPGTTLAQGFGLTANLGSVTTTEEVNIGWGRKEWGQGLWNNDGNDKADLVGFNLTPSVADVGISTEINVGWGRKAWGDLDWGGISDSIQVAPSGIGMTVALGTAVGTPNTIASPSGIALTSSLGSVSLTGTGNVTLTGNNLTSSTGSLNALIWETVDTGTAATWREVDTAA